MSPNDNKKAADGVAKTREQADRLARATGDLVENLVDNMGKLVTGVIDSSAEVSKESQGLYQSVAKHYVKTAVGTASRVVDATSEVVQEQLRKLDLSKQQR